MNTVPTLSIVFMGFTMLMGLAIPIALYCILRRRYRCDHLPFWVGCAVMLLFALVLEQLAHTLILGSAAGPRIQGNIWLYGLYGGLMAGLFEETGRYVAFRTVLKRKRSNDHNALMYGAGHGGFEAFMLLTVGMFNNLIYSLMLNTGNAALLTGGLSGDALAIAQNAFVQLAQTPSGMFLVASLERIAAVIAQISLSVLVWFAAKKGGRQLWLYPLAILLHLALNAVAVILNSYVNSILLVEAVVWLISLGYALLAWRVWRKNAAACASEEA